MISLNSVVQATQEQISSEVASESVILDLKSGQYFGLNEVGNSIWQRIQQPQTVAEICSDLLEEYDVERSQCEQDVLMILQQLHAKGLVDVWNGTTP